MKLLALYSTLAAAVATIASAPLTLADDITYLQQSDFDQGTYQITQPGSYRLSEDISFNPHPVGSLDDHGQVLDAYNAGLPFYSQYGATEQGLYDPAAFGIGFFAAIAISADGVELDLNGHRLEQSAEHALLQRFFAVVELADQPFIPAQGPSDFGGELIAARNVTIKNGVIGRNSHHGIHGNGSENVLIKNVDFEDFEVAAVALNGVQGLKILHSHARNREDVPVIGTFSNARFIAAYVDWLLMTDSETTLTVAGVEYSASEIQAELRLAVNNVFEDVIADSEGAIDADQHPLEYGLFHNSFGIIDGNAYGYLLNPLGVAVGGFPNQSMTPSSNVVMRDVHIDSQRAFINEVIALKQNDKAAIDPVGAVFMLRNVHPDSGEPLTISSLDESIARYTGNPLANAQALVAKAALNGEYQGSPLDVSRLNITPAMLAWIESGATLDSLVQSPADYLCNGDTMFHVDKGVIGFKLDGVQGARLINTSANNLLNLGAVGSEVCGDYTFSHSGATLAGYGGAALRAYSVAGSSDVLIRDSEARGLVSASGSVTGFDVMTDSSDIRLKDIKVKGVVAGFAYQANGGPSAAPDAVAVAISETATGIKVVDLESRFMLAFDEIVGVRDDSGSAIIK